MDIDLTLTAHRLGDKAASVASPLDPADLHLKPSAREILKKGSVGWLKNTEVRDLLVYHDDFQIQVAKDPPRQPAGGVHSSCTCVWQWCIAKIAGVDCSKLCRRLSLPFQSESRQVFP